MILLLKKAVYILLMGGVTVLVTASMPFSCALAAESSGSNAILFSTDSTVTRRPFLLTLTGRENGVIRYTTNGALPNAGSQVYTQPIPINASTVIRAQMFDNAGLPAGKVYTKSYLVVDYEQTLPVVSLVTDWGHLYHLHDYPEEHNQNQARPVVFEYFAPGSRVQFNVSATIRIDGSSQARLFTPKKSYRVHFEPENLFYPLFGDTPPAGFGSLVLRAAFNDAFAYTDVSGSRPHIYAAPYIGD